MTTFQDDQKKESLEPAIRRIGEQLAERSKGLAPTFFDPGWWSSTLLDWSLKDPAFKLQLFRFIDVLPTLRDDAQVIRLVDEYFGERAGAALPLRWGLRAISATRLGAALGAKSLRRQIEQMARTFVTGTTIIDALPVLERLWKSGRASSVDLLGEATLSETEADRYRDACLHALTALTDASAGWPSSEIAARDQFGDIPRINLSLKLTALYSQLDPIDPEGSYRAVAARLRPILDLAMQQSAGITIDMEYAELKDLTLTIFKQVLSEPAYRSYPHAGLALQAYLTDTDRDLQALLGWVRERGTPVSIRLVKGAYWDSEIVRYRQRGWPVPVYLRKGDTDASYEALTRRLIRHADTIRPIFGTHNLRSVAHAEAVAQGADLAAHAYEYQMIYGMAEPLQAAVTQMGRRLRLYTPVGELLPGMAYLVRRLLENTANESFLRREYVDSLPLEALLAAPAMTPPQSSRPEPAPRLEHFRNEPPTDFSQASARHDMSAALTAVRARLGGVVPYAQAPALPGSGQELVSVDPSDPTRIVGRIRACSVQDVRIAVGHALTRFRQWQRTTPAERVELLVRAAALMRARRFELAAWEIYEVGKPWRDADADVAEAIDFLEFYAREMHRLGQPQRLGDEPGELNHLVYHPRGPVAVITPWNFPLAIPAGMVAAAVVTGNVVLFKPSERSPIIGALLADLFQAAGLPEGVLQLLPGGPEIGEALVAHKDIRVIAFTGSRRVGLEILQQASHVVRGQRWVKRVIAELGGKNAVIVDDTADLDEAVAGVLASFTGYLGQKCSACSRVIVHQSVEAQFVSRLMEAVQSLQVGAAEEPGTRLGPMIDARARDTVQKYIEIGQQEGRLVCRRQVDGRGYAIGPAIFSGIQPAHRLAQEEIFGPVLAVMTAKDFDDALRLANDCDYALTGGLYSRSPVNIGRAREDFDVGNLYINRPITGALVGRQPFGGHRLSGIGAKAGGHDYLAQFMTACVVSENTLRRGFAPEP